MDEWKLADAKNRLSEVIEKAAEEGAQVITRHGKKVAYVVAADEFERQTKSGETMSALYLDLPPDDEFADLMDEIVATRNATDDRPDPFEDD